MPTTHKKIAVRLVKENGKVMILLIILALLNKIKRQPTVKKAKPIFETFSVHSSLIFG